MGNSFHLLLTSVWWLSSAEETLEKAVIVLVTQKLLPANMEFGEIGTGFHITYNVLTETRNIF